MRLQILAGALFCASFVSDVRPDAEPVNAPKWGGANRGDIYQLEIEDVGRCRAFVTNVTAVKPFQGELECGGALIGVAEIENVGETTTIVAQGRYIDTDIPIGADWLYSVAPHPAAYGIGIGAACRDAQPTHLTLFENDILLDVEATVTGVSPGAYVLFRCDYSAYRSHPSHGPGHSSANAQATCMGTDCGTYAGVGRKAWEVRAVVPTVGTAWSCSTEAHWQTDDAADHSHSHTICAKIADAP